MADDTHLKTVRDRIRLVKSRVRITKITATRCIKTSRGEFFNGMTAVWDGVEEMTLEESRVAHLLLSMETAIGAWRAARAEYAITETEFEDGIRALKRNTVRQLSDIIPAEEAETLASSEGSPLYQKRSS
jgi:hypothetical protein